MNFQQFKPYSLNLRGRLVTINRPWVMGIVNVTTDSFYSGSRTTDEESIATRVRQLVAEGADVLDLGACSTRPGSEPVTAEIEAERLAMALKIVHSVSPEMITSVDTYRSDVARRCVEEWGADIINDISGGTLDEDMFDAVAELKVPYVVTHMRGTPASMSQFTNYDNVAADVLDWMARRVDTLRQKGVADVIVDPGFGFAKTMEQNYELLSQLEVIHSLNAPLLVGVSRKRMIYQALDCTADEALNGTTAVNTAALLQGAHILRVHDVKAAVECCTISRRIMINDIK